MEQTTKTGWAVVDGEVVEVGPARKLQGIGAPYAHTSVGLVSESIIGTVYPTMDAAQAAMVGRAEGREMTQAETISTRYTMMPLGRAADGRYLDDALDEAGARKEASDTGEVRWTLPDGSVITTAGNGSGYDLGYPDCFCWRGAGHTDECAEGK